MRGIYWRCWGFGMDWMLRMYGTSMPFIVVGVSSLDHVIR